MAGNFGNFDLGMESVLGLSQSSSVDEEEMSRMENEAVPETKKQ